MITSTVLSSAWNSAAEAYACEYVLAARSVALVTGVIPASEHRSVLYLVKPTMYLLSQLRDTHAHVFLAALAADTVAVAAAVALYAASSRSKYRLALSSALKNTDMNLIHSARAMAPGSLEASNTMSLGVLLAPVLQLSVNTPVTVGWSFNSLVQLVAWSWGQEPLACPVMSASSSSFCRHGECTVVGSSTFTLSSRPSISMNVTGAEVPMATPVSGTAKCTAEAEMLVPLGYVVGLAAPQMDRMYVLPVHAEGWWGPQIVCTTLNEGW
mmetsp:Transcript_34846/g.85325  ORF Transcript_34846/g.85325 Transcript_34846/m.85325 type:complete len:269 (+) Transcript_34846:1025-1831(+)